ncbi:MAG: hypothetical protein ACM3YE_04675 [Bacteroidota bacterium]
MKTLLVLSLTICLLFSIATVASADIFRITPEISEAKLEAGDFSQSGNVYYLSGDLNFVLVRLGADLASGELEDTEFTMAGARIGTELPLFFCKLVAFAGYQTYEFDIKGVPAIEVKGSVLGVGLEKELNNFFSIRGVALVPVDLKSDAFDGEIDFNSAKIDLIFTTMPLVDFFVGYRSMKIESDESELDLSGYHAGVRIGI